MIEVDDLVCRYGPFLAVDGLTFHIAEGEIFGFIGPNGAGKTTTIRTMATLMHPESGSVKIGGLDVVEKYREVRSLIGYMPDSFGIYDDLKVWEFLDFFARSYRLPSGRRRRVIEDVLTLTDLTRKADTLVEGLSKGMTQRLCLAKTLIHDPKVLLLDEPASGLDPRARIEMRELLKELKRLGKTIFISSHILPELAELCDRIGILEGGKLIAQGGVRELTRKMKGSRVRIEVSSDLEGALARVKERPELTGAEIDIDHIVAELADPGVDLTRLIRSVIDSGVALTAFGRQAGNLEDVFLKVTQEEAL